MDEFHLNPDESAIESAPQTENGTVSPNPIPTVSAPQPTPAQNIPTQNYGNLPPIPPQNGAPAAAVPPKKSKNGVWIALCLMIAAICLLLAALAIWAAKNESMEFGVEHTIPQSVTPSYNYRDDVTADDELTNQEIIRKLSPSVVTVSISTSQSGQTSGFGTGIIYTDNGYILTNAHVVEDARKISVTDKDGKVYTAKLIGSDSDSDVAVIKIEATDLIPAEFGQSSAIVPGDRVVAIGTPYDMELAQTATVGTVSALRDGMYFQNLGYTLSLIQHDAAINSGNSGGPLVNAYGQVIGINSIKISGTYENLGFALEIDEVLPIAEQLMNNGKVVRPGIGITGQNYAADDLSGVYVYSVVTGGPADKAGLQRGDIIIEADGTVVETMTDLKNLIAKHQIGNEIELKYLRGENVYTATMTLSELTEQ